MHSLYVLQYYIIKLFMHFVVSDILSQVQGEFLQLFPLFNTKIHTYKYIVYNTSETVLSAYDIAIFF